MQLRVVKCTYENYKITDDKNCDSKSKPLNIRDCEIMPCVPTPTVVISYVRGITRLRPTITPPPTTSRVVPSWKTEGWGQVKMNIL